MQAIAKPARPVLQRGHPLVPGIVGAWALYEGAGSNVNDLSGHPKTGTVNGATWTGSLFGSALSTGGSGTVTFGVASGVTTNRLTVAALIVPIVTSRGDIVTCWENGSLAGDQFNLLYGLSAGKPQFFISNGSAAANSGTGTGSMAVGTANLIVGTFDGSAVAVYLNGVFQASSSSSLVLGTTANLRFGNNLLADGQFSGSILGVWIWNRALSGAEIAQLYFDPFAICRPRSRWWEIPTAPLIVSNAPLGWFDPDLSPVAWY